METKIGVGILGSGNIGTDLMCKISSRSKILDLKMVAGIKQDSLGLKIAHERGIETSYEGIASILERDDIEIVFDATTAEAHHMHAPLLKKAEKFCIDLTPAAVGPYVIPVINLTEHINERNVNLITCGGQATIPIIYAISTCSIIEYAEIVSTISSKSAGMGTRQSIDEFTTTTSRGIEKLGKAKKGKAIILINPAEPPMIMNNTIYVLTKNNDENRIHSVVNEMVKSVQKYVPGYRLKVPPIIEGNKITIMIEVEGSGDYLPRYSGNLDIETCAAMAIAEAMARHRLENV